MTTSARAVLPWIVVALLVAGVGSTFAPWVQTGEARRSSHEAVRSASRLDLLDGGADVVRVLWPFVPLLACLAVLAVLLDRAFVAAALAAVVGAALVALAVVVTRAPRHAAWGTTGALLTGSALLVSSALLVASSRTGAHR